MLKASRLKIARTREQLQNLDVEFGRFSVSTPNTIKQEHNLETGQYRLVYNPTAVIPTIAIVIGEIFMVIQPKSIYRYLVFDTRYHHFNSDTDVLFASGDIDEAKQVACECGTNFVVVRYDPDNGDEEIVFDAAI